LVGACFCSGSQSALDLADEITKLVEEEAERSLVATLPGKPAATDAMLESLQRGSNETTAESEESSLAETETALVETSTHADDSTPAPSSEDATLDLSSASMAMNLSSALEEEAESDAITQETESEKEADAPQCDYSVGKWVLDETRPLYSGLECTMWLSPGFSCRKHNHPDKLLDRYRWQPSGCNLPEFNATTVLES
jgi:hypothetical protein